MVLDFRQGLEESLQEVRNLSLIRGHARFTGPKTLDVCGEQVSAQTIVINTGCRPLIPPIPGLDRVPYLDNASLLELGRLPEHLAVIGGGYIGLEFAQVFARLGSRVTVVAREQRLLAREDEEVSECALDVLTGEGVDVILGAEAAAVKPGELHLDTGGVVPFSDLLVAVGRKPNTDDLGLEFAGIAVNATGFIQVDERLRTNVEGVYAIGDVNGGPAFTHISYDDFRILKGELLAGSNRTTKGRPVPYVMYLDPQLGRFGPTEAELTRAGTKFRIARLKATHIARALEMSETRGFVKALVCENDRILSATAFCVEGGELMATLQLAIEHQIPYTALRDGTFAHPSIAECLNNLFRGV
jgi:pyruvate/2-oxoglutarate dehydrogenase complex dihydrolipoamide dehydrogenase (E3) component